MAHRICSLLLVAALAACGEVSAVKPQTMSDEELGACVDKERAMVPVAFDSRPSFLSVLLDSPIVVEADAVETGSTENRTEFELSEVKPVRGATAGFDSVLASEPVGSRAAAASRDGMRFFVVGWRKTDTTHVSMIVAIPADGRVVFVGDCAYAQSARTREFLASRGRPVDVLRRILADPSGSEAEALKDHEDPPPPTWDELPPERRQIMEAPPAVRQRLTPLSLRLELPAAWGSFATTVCQRLTVALGECTTPSVGKADLIGYLEPGQDVFVQANAKDGGWDVLGPLVTIPNAVAAAAAADGKLALRLSGDPTIKDLDTLLRRGRDGPPPFTVTVVPL